MNPEQQITNNLNQIWLAGGCFWGLQAYLDKLHGVVNTNVGYANGNTDNPSYEQVCYQNTGHAETVYVQYNVQAIPLPTLLNYFFRVVNPTMLNRQGNDRGLQYRSGIYFQDPADLFLIQQALSLEQKNYSPPLVVEVLPLKNYAVAEEYHQKYLEKNPHGYCHIDIAALDSDPGTKQNRQPHNTAEQKSPYQKPAPEIIKTQLNSLQFKVTQQAGTEPAFRNEYYDNHEPGLYVDVVTGEPLFSSRDKYDSGSGWPSFTKPVDPAALVTKTDRSLFEIRTEVRSRQGDSHLGHVFNDGPPNKGGLRYCMNSAALCFISLDQMQAKGYGQYIPQVIGESTK